MYKSEMTLDFIKVGSIDFKIEETVVELIGICKTCNLIEAA